MAIISLILVNMACLNPVPVRIKRTPENIRQLEAGGYSYSNAMLVPCNKCVNCIKVKQLQWRFRLYQEMKISKNSYFCTFTINPSTMSLLESGELTPSKLIRRYCDRYRKSYGKPNLRHWFIEELGDKHGRYHLHGFVFNSKCSATNLEILWSKYGFARVRPMNLKRINYALSYLNNLDKNKFNYSFVPRVYSTSGIGSCFVRTYQKNGRNLPYPIHYLGSPIQLPRYYYNKIYSVRERAYHSLLHQQNNYKVTLKGITYDPTDINQYNLFYTRRRDYFSDSLRRCTSRLTISDNRDSSFLSQHNALTKNNQSNGNF